MGRKYKGMRRGRDGAYRKGMYAGMALRNVPNSWRSKGFKKQVEDAKTGNLYKTKKANLDFVTAFVKYFKGE